MVVLTPVSAAQGNVEPDPKIVDVDLKQVAGALSETNTHLDDNELFRSALT
jgi:hypothetical protein